MLVNFAKTRLSLLRLPLYRFCTNTEPPAPKLVIPSNLAKTDKFPGKKDKLSKPYLMLPLRTFLFPHKAYSLRVDRVFYQLLLKHEMKEVVAFPLRDAAK